MWERWRERLPSRDYPDSEARIGRALGSRRHEVTLATKCGCNPHLESQNEGRHVHIWDRQTLERNLERSLRDLRTDYIDIWQMHMATPDDLLHDPNHEAIRIMQEARDAGKVRFIGVALRHGFSDESGFPTSYGYDGIREFMNWGVFDMFQIGDGAMFRTSEIAIRRAGGLGHAIVARAIQKDYSGDADERFARAGLHELTDGVDRRSFLIRFAISHLSVSTALVGTSCVEHLRANAAAAELGPLPPDVHAEACRRLSGMGYDPEPGGHS